MPDYSRDPLPSRIEQRIDTHLAVSRRIREKAAPAGPVPFITISRQYGCEAMELAEHLARELAVVERLSEGSWQVYSRRIVEDISTELQLSKRLVEALDARVRSDLEEFFETLMGHAPPDIEVLRHLVHTVRALALHGRCILVGRGAAMLSAGLAGGIHVRLIAPEPWRLTRLVSRFGWDESKARSFVRGEEDNRRNFFQKYLGQDVNNPEHYDLIINAARMNREEQVESVIALFRKRFIHA